MVDMEKRQKLLVGLTRGHKRSGSSSPPIDSNGDESEGGGHNAAIRRKKGKGKASKWRLSNGGMNGKTEAERSDGGYNDSVPSSVTTTSFSSLISRKRVRTLGKVAEDCDAMDPTTVPRKLRSAINKCAGRTVSMLSPKFKKRRHLSIANTQSSFMDCEMRFNQSLLHNSFTKVEEVVAEALLSLSQVPPLCEPMPNKAMSEDRSNTNVASTSCSGATKKGSNITASPFATNEVASQSACTDQPVERADNVPQVRPVLSATNQHQNSIDLPLSKDEAQDVSLGLVTNLPILSKDSSGNSSQKQIKVQFDENPSHPAQKPEVAGWLVSSNKSAVMVHEEKRAKNTNVEEIAPLVQSPLSCTSHGLSSNTLTASTNTANGAVKASSTGHFGKLSQINGGLKKAWKRCLTHVYVSHLIQMHLNKEKASTLANRAKPEERLHTCISRPPSNYTFNKNNIQEESVHTMHWNVRLPVVQPSSGVYDTTTGQQKTMSGNFLNPPATTTGLKLSGAHVQYLHPQVGPRGAMPCPFPHAPYTQENLAPTTIQQMPQYMCNPCYSPRPGLTRSSTAVKLQQLVPVQHQQQQMWQFNVPSQYQAAPDAAAAAAWQNSRLQDQASLRPMPLLRQAMPPQMELLCAAYQAGGRQLPQLRLI